MSRTSFPDLFIEPEALFVENSFAIWSAKCNFDEKIKTTHEQDIALGYTFSLHPRHFGGIEHGTGLIRPQLFRCGSHPRHHRENRQRSSAPIETAPRA
jgi:hypothetical protein